MIDNFPAFAKLVADQFQFFMEHDEVFVTNVVPDDLYQRYLESFPEGTNPLFRERTEHDCSCCKQFIRRVGNIVAVAEDGSLQTVWDDAAEKAPAPYNIVATLMKEAVLSEQISDIFRINQKEGAFGAEKTRGTDKNGELEVWHHFFTGNIPNKFRPHNPDAVKGDYRSSVQVFERGLTELSHGAVETVIDLIDSNSVYRGQEHRPAVVGFFQAQKEYQETDNKSTFAWVNAKYRGARFRNSAIGTLVQDISEGKDIEEAVVSFGKKMDPANYKRPKKIITQAMVKEAMKTIEELGLEPALQRRFARIEDISVNDVLWVDNSVKPRMKDGIGGMLMAEAKSSRDNGSDEKRAEEISLDDFVSRVLPEASSMEILFKGDHLGNLMSLTAPVIDEPKQLFRWDNDFAWSYAGNIADSTIKQRVKQAGGKVTGVELRTSLSWFNADDLDIHVHSPKDHIHFSHMRGRCGGHLDVDMNVHAHGNRFSRNAVENVVWQKVIDGVYRVVINNYTHRESHDVGFTVEVECGGQLHHFSYTKEVRARQDVEVVKLHVKNGAIVKFEVGPGITTTSVSQEKWGLKTEDYVKVNAVTISPNYWGENAVGNKHMFFVLEGALNDEPTRGIYNEFLHPRLEKHRKVFEVIGEKTKCEPTEGQLSGLGFSSTKKDSVLIRVNQRLFNVQIGA